MASCRKSRFWPICRICFRRCRITLWLIILALLAAAVYLNQIGLPGFVKRPLLEKLRERGIDLQFSRLRVRWYEGVVAENVRFGRADRQVGPQLKLAEVQLRLNPRSLARFQLQVDSLVLRQGRLVWPISETNQLMRQLTVENIQTDLRLLPNDQWALDKFTAAFGGAKIRLSGTVSNASVVRDWKLFQTRQHVAPGAWQNRLRQLADAIERIQFAAPPELMLDINGDARDLQSFQARLSLSAPAAETPWGTVSQGRFTARLFPASGNDHSRAELSLDAADAQTPWAAITNLQMTLSLAAIGSQTNLLQADLFLLAGQAQTKWGGASNSQFTAQWTHPLSNSIPFAGAGQFISEQVETQWGSARKIQLAFHLATPSAPDPASSGSARTNSEVTLQGPGSASDPALGWWTNLQPFQLDWESHLVQLQTPKLEADEIALGGSWCAPRLAITNLHAKLYGGEMDARAGLDVETRALDASATSNVDPHKFSPLLTEGARHWLSNYSWIKPPELQMAGSVVLPAWTNRQPDWRAEVQPTLRLDGHFKVTHGGAYQQVQFTTAESHLSYSNMFWRLPDLTATRPEGRIEAEHLSNDRTKDYYWRIQSSIDPMAMRPLFETNQQRGFGFFTFTQPPVISAEIWGRWHDHERLGLKAQVAVTNFTFKGESVSGLQTGLQYTNLYLLLSEPSAQHGEQHVSAESLAIDFKAQRILLTNGFGTVDPGIVTRAISSNVARIMEPYRFLRPVTARVHGIIPMRRDEDADMYFQVAGGPFHWWKFNLPQIVGDVHWIGQRLTLTDMRADFYGGNATGAATFNFHPQHGTDYQFAITTTNTLLQSLMADLVPRTNHLEGFLNGTLRIEHANSADWQQMAGHGSLDLRDGLIWDIPVFGIFTPILNGISPGLGTSRASAATGTFVITKGVIRSDDLEIRSPAMRLEYRGTVDLQGQVNARVEAELLRDVWGVGPIISTVFWPVTKMLEYKVSGTLGQPKVEPVFFILRGMLMPFRSLKEIVPEDSTASRTNGPPFRTQ